MMTAKTTISLLTISILMISYIATITQYVKATSIVGNYADGYEEGKESGSDDYRSGRQHNSKCPPNDSLSWRTGYKVGYEAGWFAAAALDRR